MFRAMLRSISRLQCPTPLIKEIESEERLPGVVGPLTACQAWEPVLRAAECVDPKLRLTLVTTEDVSHEGRAYVWEFLIDFPRRAASGIFTVRPRERDSEPDGQEACIVTRVKPQRTPSVAGLLAGRKIDRLTAGMLGAWTRLGVLGSTSPGVPRLLDGGP